MVTQDPPLVTLVAEAYSAANNKIKEIKKKNQNL